MKLFTLIRAVLASMICALVAGKLYAADQLPSTADADWKAFQDAVPTRLPDNVAAMPVLERLQLLEKIYVTLHTQGLAFIEKNPADPRRWSVVMRLSPTQPKFIKAEPLNPSSTRPPSPRGRLNTRNLKLIWP